MGNMLGWTGLLVGSILLAGCGGGGDSTPPSVSNAVIVTSPTTVTYLGGSATLRATVTDATGVDSSTVKVTVLVNGTANGAGPVVMTPTATAGVYTYTVALANNILGTSPVTYSFQITATDLQGHAMLTPANAGSVTVPVVPGPPGSP